MTVETLEKFAEDVLSGKGKKSYKGQDPPEINNGPLFTIVRKNFHDFTADGKHYTFVMFYSPRCGHCNRMKPAWQKLAESYANHPIARIA